MSTFRAAVWAAVAFGIISVNPVWAAVNDEPPDPATVRKAVAAGLEVVQKAAARYPTHRKCFSCHHQTLPMLAMAAARDAGLAADSKLLAAQADFTHQSFQPRVEDLKKGQGVGGRAMTVGYAFWALELAGRKPDDVTEAMVAYLLQTQKPAGNWERQMSRPPLEDSNATCTVLAAYGLRKFAGLARRPQVEAALAKARIWLAAAKPQSHEDQVAALRASVLLGPAWGPLRPARDGVLKAQRADGGWSQLPDLASDAYATGQSLFALSEAGLAPSDPAFRRGVRFLLKTQCPDGSWHVQTRSRPVQTAFDNGDPHGKDQFISTPATAWAVAGLARALRGQPGKQAVERANSE